MNLFVALMLIVAGIGALAYHRAPLWLWTVTCGVLLASITPVYGFFANLLLLIGWTVWIGLFAANFPELRRGLLSKPALEMFRSRMPSVSTTEQEALDAGTVWWDAELFSGKPDWQRLLSLPKPTLSAEEQAFVDGPTEELCRMVDNWEIERELVDLPEQVWQFIKEQGFLGMIIPKRYGGLGFSALGHSAVIMKLSSRCGTAAVSVMVPNSLGPAELLLRYGTDAQRDHYLPRLAKGAEIPCFALTNPYAGSDAAAIPDRGIVCYGEHGGEQVLGMRVTWEKRYITLGPVSTLLGLAFQLHDPDKLLGEQGAAGITLALIPTDHPGVEIGRRHYPGQQAFQNGPNSGEDVFIPMDWVIGGQPRSGQGWRMLMNCLAAGRSISLPASSTGGLKFCARTTGAYARVRKQFNVPIGKMEGIEEPLARIAGNTYAVDAARQVTAGTLDQGEEPSVLSALLKYQATERVRSAINDAMDIHGGRAICDGPNNYLFAAYQAVPIAITVEGANILTRTLIVFGQGAIRCHPWLYKEIQAAQEKDDNRALDLFDEALCGHISFVMANGWRAFWHNLTGGRLNRRLPDAGYATAWYAQLERSSASFALLADLALLLLGGELKRRESLSGRFADVFGEMYLMSCALKRFEDDGRLREDRPLLDWVCTSSLYNIQQTFSEILANFPSKLLALKMRFVLFPFGMQRRPASDKLGHQIAKMLLAPSEARDRLTAGIYVNSEPDDVTGCLEHALSLVIEADAIDKRLGNALRDGRLTAATRVELIAQAEQAEIINSDEVTLLTAADRAVRRAIDVDDFDPSELGITAANGTSAIADVA